jgi:hypothetical protein
LLAAIVVSVVVIMVAAMASFACFFQVMAAPLRLAAVFAMFAFRIVQLGFGLVDTVFAFSVIVAINRPCGNCSAQERENNERRNECSGSCEHATS